MIVMNIERQNKERSIVFHSLHFVVLFSHLAILKI